MYAGARQIVGKSEVTLEVPEPATVLDLRARLKTEYPGLGNVFANILIAVDHEFAVDSQKIQAGSEIALIPPVSGGLDD